MTGAASGALFAPQLGRLSDRVGRKRILLLSMLGFALAFSLYSLLQNFLHAFFIQAVEGIGWAAIGATVPALIADITPQEKRGWAMGVYERTWSVGWIVGPLLGGFLAESIGFRFTFLIGSATVAVGVLGLRLL